MGRMKYVCGTINHRLYLFNLKGRREGSEELDFACLPVGRDWGFWISNEQLTTNNQPLSFYPCPYAIIRVNKGRDQVSGIREKTVARCKFQVVRFKENKSFLSC
jgi:hypothetical protein